jgi:hypothetical protein
MLKLTQDIQVPFLAWMKFDLEITSSLMEIFEDYP